MDWPIKPINICTIILHDEYFTLSTQLLMITLRILNTQTITLINHHFELNLIYYFFFFIIWNILYGKHIPMIVI